MKENLKIMNLTYFRPKMRKCGKKQPSQHQISRQDIRNLSENITSDVILKYQTRQHWNQ